MRCVIVLRTITDRLKSTSICLVLRLVFLKYFHELRQFFVHIGTAPSETSRKQTRHSKIIRL